MTSNQEPKSPTVILDDESSFDRAMVFTWRHKVPLLVMVCLGAALGFATSFLFTPKFRADAILIASDETLGANLSGTLGSLGGLASLVGLDKSANKENEAVETLKSRALTSKYIEANHLLPILFQKRWDSINGKWKPDGSSRVPTVNDGFLLFDKEIRNVVENRKTGLINISVTWEDPILAKQWVDGLVDAANDVLRLRAVDRSSRNLEYLKKAAESTTVFEVKTTIYKLMETEIKKQMLATGGKDYAFRVVDPAVVPERKVFPIRGLFLILGAILIPGLWCTFFALKTYKQKTIR
jgi:uncharacterized protein involved in exopolysaccharide biosynthesis